MQLNIRKKNLTTLKAVAITITLQIFATSASAYDLPFFANDLKAGERYYTKDHAVTSTQKHGYDVTAKRRKNDGTWTSLKPGVVNHWDDPKNSSYVVWGKPFYAIADGLIIGCWRRGPDNPRPKLPSENSDDIPFEDREWLSQAFRDGLLPGGGNMLWVLNDDGTRTLYAHAVKDSISASLCPKPKTVYDAPKSSSDTKDEHGMSFQIALDPNDRKRVKRGQFLGLIGHSGSSTGPHHHFHTEKKNLDGIWVAKEMKFSRGLSTPWNNGSPSFDNWYSFSGNSIPAGKQLIWPPRRLSKEYARHQFAAGDMKRMFKHLANSGFMPEVLDCYSVAGKVFYNMIWRKANINWRAYYGQTSTKYQQRFNKAKQDGYAPVYVESCLSGSNIRYAVIFKKTPGAYRAKHNLTPAQHQAVFNQAKADGYKPVNVAVTSNNGSRRYTVLYRKESIGSWRLKSFLTNAQYQQAVLDNKAAGRKPSYINVYMHNGQSRFSAIFSSKPSGSWKARHNMTKAGYQNEWQSAINSGKLTRTVAGYDGAQANHRFAAMWRK